MLESHLHCGSPCSRPRLRIHYYAMHRCCVIKKVYARRKDYFSTVRVGVRTRRVALKGLVCAVEVPLQRIPAAVVVESVEHGKLDTTKADKSIKSARMLPVWTYPPDLYLYAHVGPQVARSRPQTQSQRFQPQS